MSEKKAYYFLCRNDMKSKSWQTEIEGLSAIVRLIKYHSDIIVADLDGVINALIHECKNLRSQVSLIKLLARGCILSIEQESAEFSFRALHLNHRLG